MNEIELVSMNDTTRINNNFAIIEKDEEVIISEWQIHSLDSLEELEQLQEETRKNIVFITPFCLARDEKWYDAIWEEKILAMEVESELKTTRDELLKLLPNSEVKLGEITPDISGEDFVDMVESAKLEINNWNINQVVLSREFKADIEINQDSILSMYSKLLQNRWQYMTYLFNTPDKIFIWASPEKHLQIEEWHIYMNPIAWTFWKKDPETFMKRFLDFLGDDKEIWELAMVIDEELKMMAKITQSWTIEGPLLKEVWAVIHTEANLKWEQKNDFSMMDSLRETMYAPTLVWWPLESAFSEITKYEQNSREYYWWAFWILWKDFLDSAIVIRTAFINKIDSILSVRAWAWIVKDSNPAKEAEETILKSSWFFGSIKWWNSSNSKSHLTEIGKDEEYEIEELLEKRKSKLSNFYMNSNLDENLENNKIKWKKFILINSWDDFVFLSGFMIEKMWWIVEVIDNKDFDIEKVDNYDIVLLWPWYWDINDENDDKMINLLNITKVLIENNKKTLWICLWHQAICKTKGFNIEKQDEIWQWEQEKVTINWKTETLWFYNSFSPVFNEKKDSIESFKWDRILKLSETNISSIQAHPESIMSTTWFKVLEDMILEILD